MKSVDKNLIDKIRSMDGAITVMEYKKLHDLAKEVRDGWIVEVGSYRGCSTVALAMGSKHGANVPVVAVEPHEEFKGVLGGSYGWKDRREFFKNMVRWDVCDVIRLVNLSSEGVAPIWSKKVSLLWLDGDHSYEGVRRDFDLWEPHVSVGGIVVIHDSECVGPASLLSEIMIEGNFEKVGVVGKKMTILRKLKR